MYNIQRGEIMNNQEKFNELRKKYDKFIYEKYDISFDEEYLNITYHFNIPNLTYFYPKIKLILIGSLMNI